MPKITKKQALASDDNEQFILFLSRSNNPEYNYLKALEECSEFMEVLCKLQTKHKDSSKRPDAYNLITEFADLMYRGTIAIHTFFPELTIDGLQEHIEEHVDKKLSALKNLLAKNKHNSGKL